MKRRITAVALLAAVLLSAAACGKKNTLDKAPHIPPPVTKGGLIDYGSVLGFANLPPMGGTVVDPQSSAGAGASSETGAVVNSSVTGSASSQIMSVSSVVSQNTTQEELPKFYFTQSDGSLTYFDGLAQKQLFKSGVLDFHAYGSTYLVRVKDGIVFYDTNLKQTYATPSLGANLSLLTEDGKAIYVNNRQELMLTSHDLSIKDRKLASNVVGILSDNSYRILYLTKENGVIHMYRYDLARNITLPVDLSKEGTVTNARLLALMEHLVAVGIYNTDGVLQKLVVYNMTGERIRELPVEDAASFASIAGTADSKTLLYTMTYSKNGKTTQNHYEATLTDSSAPKESKFFDFYQSGGRKFYRDEQGVLYMGSPFYASQAVRIGDSKVKAYAGETFIACADSRTNAVFTAKLTDFTNSYRVCIQNLSPVKVIFPKYAS